MKTDRVLKVASAMAFLFAALPLSGQDPPQCRVCAVMPASDINKPFPVLYGPNGTTSTNYARAYILRIPPMTTARASWASNAGDPNEAHVYDTDQFTLASRAVWSSRASSVAFFRNRSPQERWLLITAWQLKPVLDDSNTCLFCTKIHWHQDELKIREQWINSVTIGGNDDQPDSDFDDAIITFVCAGADTPIPGDSKIINLEKK